MSLSLDSQIRLINPRLSVFGESHWLTEGPHFETALLHEQEFYRNGQIDDLNNAIAGYEAYLKSLNPTSCMKQYQIRLGGLYTRRFETGTQVQDLEKAISNYEAGEEASRNGFRRLLSMDSSSYLDLASLYEQRFVWENRISDLDNAIIAIKTGIEHSREPLLQDPTYPFKLARLYEQRFDWSGRSLDIRNAVANQEMGLDLLSSLDPDRPMQLAELTRMRLRLQEVTKGRLLEDLQQIAKYIMKPKLRVDVVDLMEEVIIILEDNNSNKLCADIRDYSVRLGTYCEAIRSQVGRGMDRDHIQALYDEIVTTEREISAAYKNLATKYEKMYKLWREKREQISSMLSPLDSGDLRNYTQDIQTRIQRVDEGFETIRKTLDNQQRFLKDYFDTCKARIASTHSTQEPPLDAVPPDNPELGGGLVDPPFHPSELPKTVKAGKEKLSAVSDDVGKARYTKARKRIEDKISTTAFQLDKLYCVSREYELNVQELSASQQPIRYTRWSRWREPSHQLPNFIKSMTNQLAGIQRGFDKYKRSILGLIFRPLSDMIEDLKPYFSQVGQKVVTERLHPDMILYEAAFLFLIKSLSVPLGLTEQIEEWKSRLEVTITRD